MPLNRRQFAVVATMLASACSTADEPAISVEAEEAPAMRTAGSMLVEYDPAQSNGLSVHAQFLEVSGVSVEAALDALDAWTPDATLAEDVCSIRARNEVGSDDVRLRLLDVGPISVGALGHAIELNGRRLPDLSDVYGVVYGNEEGFDFDEAFLPYAPHTTYQIEAPGGDVAGGFGLALQAPSVPEIVAVAGRYLVDDNPIALDGRDLSIEWEPAGESASLFLDVVAGNQRLQCRVEDDGRFEVPASAFDGFAEDAVLTVKLRRVDAVELAIDGIESGAFVFAATDEARVVR